MVSLVVHALLGIVVLVILIRANASIFRRVPVGPPVSALELFYYVVGIASVVLGYYFNHQYVQEYSVPGEHNALWGSTAVGVSSSRWVTRIRRPVRPARTTR